MATKTLTKRQPKKAVKKPANKAASSQAEKPATLIAYKGFNSDFACTGGGKPFQYEVGKTYVHDGQVVACESGFHACENPLDVLRYYAPIGSRFGIVEQSGDIARHEGDSKIASSRLTVKAEISLPGLIKAGIEYTFKLAKNPTSGYCAHSATSGNRAHSATSGDRAHSATSGDRAHSATSGDYANSATSGYCAAAEAKGKSAVAANAGNGRAKAGEGGAIFLVERDSCLNILAVFASKVGENGIAADTWYVLRGGKPVEVK